MDGKGPVRRDGGIARIGNHGAGAAAVFLGGLEHQDDPSPPYRPPRQQSAKAQKHGHMAVMPAQMSLPLGLGLPVGAACLGDGKGVELGPEQHCRSGFRTREHGSHAMTTKSAEDLVGLKPFKRLPDLGGGPFFLARQLGPAVKVPAKRHEFGNVGICQHGRGAGALSSGAVFQAGSR